MITLMPAIFISLATGYRTAHKKVPCCRTQGLIQMPVGKAGLASAHAVSHWLSERY